MDVDAVCGGHDQGRQSEVRFGSAERSGGDINAREGADKIIKPVLGEKTFFGGRNVMAEPVSLSFCSRIESFSVRNLNGMTDDRARNRGRLFDGQRRSVSSSYL